MATSCGMMNTVTKRSQYAKMYEKKPVTLLVMPPLKENTVLSICLTWRLLQKARM